MVTRGYLLDNRLTTSQAEESSYEGSIKEEATVSGFYGKYFNMN